MSNPGSINETATEEYLYGRINYERRTDDAPDAWMFKLETVLQLLNRRGNPHWRYPVIHVAGTKGKGSVVAMIARILRAAGYSTGVYSSPHLEIIRERIVVNGEMISAADFTDLIDSFKADVAALDEKSQERKELHPPSFFEIITAAAFDYFAHRRVDAAVIEVGMGGRLDSTNVCRPEITVITNIGIDHQRQLGATRSLIAAEKAGIIKPGVPLICGVQRGKPVEVIANVARKHNAPVFWLGQDFRCKVGRQDLNEHGTTSFDTWGQVGQEYTLPDCRTSLIGHHQATNAAIAVATTQWLAHHRWHISEDAIRMGLQKVEMPGRFQLIEGPPPVVLDIAHNEISVRAFARTFVERFGPDRNRRTLIFSASRDKKILRMLRLLLPLFDRVILTKIITNPRGCDLATLEGLCRKVFDRWAASNVPMPQVETAEDSRRAGSLVLDSARLPRCVAVTGSAFLVGEMLPVARSWSSMKRPFIDQVPVIE